eukprot:UN07476
MTTVIGQCWSLKTQQSKGKVVMMKSKRLIFFLSFFFSIFKKVQMFLILFNQTLILNDKLVLFLL